MTDYAKLLGLSVISIEEGSRCGKVVDLLVDYKKFEVYALIVKGGWNKDAEIVRFKDIESIGPDVVMILNAKSIKKATKLPEVMKTIEGHVNINKLQVITRTGHVIGKIATFEFDPLTGKVQQFEIAGSVLKSIFEGRNVIAVKRIISVGKDAMIVKDKETTKKSAPKAEPKKADKKPAPKAAAKKAPAKKKPAAKKKAAAKKKPAKKKK